MEGFTELVGALDYVGLVDLFSEEKINMCFAPTDDAFYDL
jgi:uncharacterized surface protein with fasciclin (FAS1) repeats